MSCAISAPATSHDLRVPQELPTTCPQHLPRPENWRQRRDACAPGSEQEAPDIARLNEFLIRAARFAVPGLTGVAHLVSPLGEVLPLPPTIFTLLARAVHTLASGQAALLMPYEAELTTQQAADM